MRTFWLWGAAMLVVGAGCSTPDEATVDHVVIERFDTVVTAEQATIGEIADLLIGADGEVWVADRANAQVLAISNARPGMRTIGRKGSGPGELLRPEALAFREGSLVVLDIGNKLVQYFAADGMPTEHFSLNRMVLLPAALNGHGEIATQTLGQDSSLVLVLSNGTNVHRRVGIPVVPPPMGMSLSHIREQAKRGDIPVEFRNNVLPAIDTAGNVWLVLQADGRVQRYDDTNRMVWERTLPQDVIAQSRDQFLSEASGDWQLPRVPVPRVAASARAYAGELWVMVSSGKDQKNRLLVLDEHGQVRREIALNLTGAGPFSVDTRQRQLVIAVPEDGMIVRAQLK